MKAPFLPNNPRVFEGVVSLDVWRTPYSPTDGRASLYVDVNFLDNARLGNEIVTFTLSLKRAEVFIRRDNSATVQLDPATFQRQRPDVIKTTERTSLRKKLAGLIGFKLGPTDATVAASGEAGVERDAQTTQEFTREHSQLYYQHLKFHDGYGYRITPLSGKVALSGPPWSSSEPRLDILDTGYTRKRGVNPEVTVEIRCLREDLNVSHVELTDKSGVNILNISKSKGLAVEAYIRDQLARAGLSNSDISNPLSLILLADASPEELHVRSDA